MNECGFVDDEEAVVELVGGLDREFGRCSQCRWRGGSSHERRGGAMMRRARRAILGAKSGLFELQGATGESDKVR